MRELSRFEIQVLSYLDKMTTRGQVFTRAEGEVMVSNYCVSNGKSTRNIVNKYKFTQLLKKSNNYKIHHKGRKITEWIRIN